MTIDQQNRIEMIRPLLVMASIFLSCALMFVGWRVLDMSLPGPARTMRGIPEQWSMRLAAGAALLTAQAVLIGALPLIWRRRALHAVALKVIAVIVVLASVASLSLALAK